MYLGHRTCTDSLLPGRNCQREQHRFREDGSPARIRAGFAESLGAGHVTVCWPRQASLPSAGHEVQFLRVPVPVQPRQGLVAPLLQLRVLESKGTKQHVLCGKLRLQPLAVWCHRGRMEDLKLLLCRSAHRDRPTQKFSIKTILVAGVLTLSREQQTNNNARPEAFARLLSNKLYTIQTTAWQKIAC